jgi:hypothetical protein
VRDKLFKQAKEAALKNLGGCVEKKRSDGRRRGRWDDDDDSEYGTAWNPSRPSVHHICNLSHHLWSLLTILVAADVAGTARRTTRTRRTTTLRTRIDTMTTSTSRRSEGQMSCERWLRDRQGRAKRRRKGCRCPRRKRRSTAARSASKQHR